MPQKAEFTRVFERFKVLLLDALESKQLSQQQGILLCTILGYAENVDQLKILFRALSDEYPICAELISTEKEERATKESEQAEEYLRKLIKEDPVKAGEFSKALADKRLSHAELLKKFPNLTQYIS
jgi:2-oxo-4-hydroxy-4-carboxy--5-ureidoimidazoline (OHCU) decarboxylase